MELIADKDGVDVISNNVKVNLDFNFGIQHIYNLDHRQRDWDLKIKDGKNLIAHVKFTAYQFLCDGIERRTVALREINVEPIYQNKTFEVLQFILNTVNKECDLKWGKLDSDAVLFIEKKHLKHLDDKEKHSFFEFIKKLGEKILGCSSHNQNDNTDLSVSVIGDQITMQLIQEHLLRSNSA